MNEECSVYVCTSVLATAFVYFAFLLSACVCVAPSVFHRLLMPRAGEGDELIIKRRHFANGRKQGRIREEKLYEKEVAVAFQLSKRATAE